LFARLSYCTCSLYLCVVVSLYAIWSHTASIIPTMTLTIYTRMYTTHRAWSVSYVQPLTISWISMLLYPIAAKKKKNREKCRKAMQ
jgi:hypothetical protein